MNKLLKVNGRGKNEMLLEGESMAMLKIWAMQNTKGKAKCYIADSSNKVVMIISGVPGSLPTIDKNPPELYLENEDEQEKENI
ncbi:MAG: hypothetical protein K0Q47_39 [Sedimentibacter sp.]|jgi:hypothetical protein|nr:hypothetical protein [Sedimentibacter sp.]